MAQVVLQAEYILRHLTDAVGVAGTEGRSFGRRGVGKVLGAVDVAWTDDEHARRCGEGEAGGRQVKLFSINNISLWIIMISNNSAESGVDLLDIE